MQDQTILAPPLQRPLTARDNSDAPPADDAMPAWPAYLLDAFQRAVLFLDLLRQRGNTQIATAARPTATVLRFDTEELMSGAGLARPINYTLSRVLPPPGAATDPRKRPVVVIDPRAGQGAGIGGFKPDSEIGDALGAGHPVYFIGFGAHPAPGQQFLDVVEGQVAFFERVAARHPDAPRPFAIGNCQAGYQTLMVAMLRPELFGPCLVPGSPMSYWQGVHGKNPMRYSGGLLGGSWLNALASDLGNGKVDGTGLVLNFDNLNPAYWLWGKQYELYASIDEGGARYLAFEKWWGDFIELNGDELQYLVDNLFIGDKLTRNQLRSRGGTPFDLRNVTSPIVVFTSSEDNISPPPQSLGWIPDLYRDVDDIRATGRTILYCLSHKIGHLAIFVSTKVGAKQDEEFVQMMDVIDCLPPGLYEIVITPRPPDLPPGGFATGNWFARFEGRTLDDILALGRNSAADDRAFAAVARLSELNLSLYRSLMQPWVRAGASQAMAELTRALNPLRLSYTIFADANPWMRGVKALAAGVAAHRQPAPAGNPLLALQAAASDRINAALNAYRDQRDRLAEQTFFGVYGSPWLQALLGIPPDSAARPPPGLAPGAGAARRAMAATYETRLDSGGFNEALLRAALYVIEADRSLDQRAAFALNAAREGQMHLSLAEFKAKVREQFCLLQFDRERALRAIAAMLPETDLRRALLVQLRAIVGADAAPGTAADACLERLAQMLDMADEPAPALAASAPPAHARAGKAPVPVAQRPH